MAISDTTIPTTTTGVVPVPNSSIQPSTPITMPQTQGLNSVDANAFGMLLGKQADQTQQLAAQDQANANAEANNNQSLQDLLLGKEQFAQDQANAQNLPALQKQARDLQSTSMLQTANYIQGIRNIDQKNISQGERNSAQIEAQRQNGIDALLTNAQLSFTQGNIQSAQAQVKAAVDLKYNAIEQRIANSDKVLSRLDAIAGRSDAKAVQAAKDRNEQLKADIVEKKANDLKIQQAIIDATPFAPASVISQAQQAFKDGKGTLEVARILGKYGGDYMKVLQLKSQIETDKVQRAKLNQDILESKSKMTPTAPVTITNAQGQQVAISPQAQQAAEAYGLVSTILNSTNLETAVGASSVFNRVPGTAGRDFELKVEQLKNALAVPNLDKLKGATSDKDIMFIKNIVTSLDTSMSPEAFKSEATKIQNIMKKTAVAGGYDDATLSEVVQQDAPKPVNKFQQSLGVAGSQPFQGTSIINKVTDNGDIYFSLPK